MSGPYADFQKRGGGGGEFRYFAEGDVNHKKILIGG